LEEEEGRKERKKEEEALVISNFIYLFIYLVFFCQNSYNGDKRKSSEKGYKGFYSNLFTLFLGWKIETKSHG
jgi:hypothetical protein